MAARRPPSWRFLVPVTFVLAGVLFVTSAISSGGTDLRAGRFSDLASLVNQQSQQVQALRARARTLSEQVNALSGRIGSHHVSKARQEALALRGPVGLNPVTGPGLTVTLDDAPSDVIASADTNPNNLVVHQQDIQAVANALWAGGAEAMMIMDQRVLTTSAVRCIGNTLLLQGRTYSPPFVVTAIGNAAAMSAALDNEPGVQLLLQYVNKYQLGYEVKVVDTAALPAYDGPVRMTTARQEGR